MAEDDEVEFIDNPNPIAAKTKAIVGRSADDMLKAADKKIGNLKEEFALLLRKENDRIGAALQIAQTDPGKAKAAVDRIRRISHELRGQGGTFGYPLVTEVCDSLCKLIDVTETGDAQTKIVRTHVDALRAIVTANIEGDGGAIGKELMSSLRQIQEKLGVTG